MTTPIRLLIAVSLIVLSTSIIAADAQENPAFVSVEDMPGLPRVLLIGDSISVGYTLPTRAELDNVANVHRPEMNCGPTTRGLEHIDQWLGEKKWDVIHFNWGLHDLKFMNEKGDLVAIEKGTIQVPIDEYEKNLDTLVTRMKETGATLIFATTTPVPEGANGRIPADAPRYNEAALRVMKKHGVAIDDLYNAVSPHLKTYQRPANVHFTDEGSTFLAGQVAASIVAALNKNDPTFP